MEGRGVLEGTVGLLRAGVLGPSWKQYLARVVPESPEGASRVELYPAGGRKPQQGEGKAIVRRWLRTSALLCPTAHRRAPSRRTPATPARIHARPALDRRIAPSWLEPSTPDPLAPRRPTPPRPSLHRSG